MRDDGYARVIIALLKLGRYEVVRELGKGAMGIVYLAKDPLIGRLVALKTIRPAAHSDDDDTKEFQQRFVREAQAAGILNHPSIVTVHDIGQDETTGVSFIAMEYVEGQNLKEVLSQGRPISFEQIGDIIAQIGEALDFAHSKGIVHRDVKPANIILLEGNRAKITDFGIAKIASGVSNLTSTGQFLGTPNYMAPEQIKGSPVDGRSDLFSLGICLYECLTRRKPFGGDSLTSISYKIVHESFPPLQEVNPQIPEGYEEIVATCLQKDPAKRYQRGRDLANAVRAVVRGERPVRAHEPALEEATIVTRDMQKIPTVEIPFPEASAALDAYGTATTAAAAAAIAANAAIPAAPPAAARPRPAAKPGGGAGRIVRHTLDGVRAYPLWYRPIAAPVFFGIIAAAILVLVLFVANIRRQSAPAAIVDTAAEARVAKERRLRLEANQLLRQGNVAGAYEKYAELNKLAPSSDYVNAVMQKLSAIRQQEEVSRQQLTQAKQLFDQGIALYNAKQYAQAIEIFQQSFHLNPNSQETAKYLQMAQDEDDKARQARLTAARPKTAVPPRPGVQVTPQQQAQNGSGQRAAQPVAPAVFTTYFNSPFADGYIMVKVGADVVAHENLFEERRLFHRHVARVVTVSSAIPPKNADVEIWVVVPSQQVNEHRVLRGNFAPGTVHRLTVAADARTKQFSYQLN